MLIKVISGIILTCGVVALLSGQAFSQTSKPPLPKSHRHIGVKRYATGEKIPEFKMVEASLEPDTKKEDLVGSRSGNYDAFTVSGTRLFVTDKHAGKIFEITGLPLEWRPFSDLIWADSRTLMFDRWSQPHYAVHYALNAETRQLVAAVPFPDNVIYDPQRPKH